MSDSMKQGLKVQFKPLDMTSISIIKNLTNPAMQGLLRDVVMAISEHLPIVKPKPALNQIKFWVVPSSKESDCLIYIEVKGGKFHGHLAKMTPNTLTHDSPEWLRNAVSDSRKGHHLLSKITINEFNLEKKESIVEFFSLVSGRLSNNNRIPPPLSHL